MVDELLAAIGGRLRQLVRPLDSVTRPDHNMFGIVLTQTAPFGNGEAFRRIFDSLYMRSFKTSKGFIPIVIGMSICMVDANTGFPPAQALLDTASRGIPQSFDSGTVTQMTVDPVAAH